MTFADFAVDMPRLGVGGFPVFVPQEVRVLQGSDGQSD